MRHIVLEGEKVCLATPERKDIKKIYEYYGKWELRRHLGEPRSNFPVFYEDEEKFYEEIIENKNRKEEIILAIIEKESNELVGLIGLYGIRWVSRSAEIECWIGKEYWGKGYATEAVRLMLKYAFEYLNLNKVWAGVIEGNKASIRVLEKNGFKLVGRMRKHEWVPGAGYQDSLVFEILREEYESKE